MNSILFVVACVAVLAMAIGQVVAFDIADAYESTEGQPGCQPCTYPSTTGSCSCPYPQTTTTFRFTTECDCAGNDELRVGQGAICASGPATQPLEGYFGGSYQLDDTVPGGDGCRHPNPLFNNRCECPVGFSSFSFRMLPDSHTGSQLNMCFNTSAPGGGAYEVYDGQGCKQGNPYTGNQCTCPPGYQGIDLRTIVDGPHGAHLIICSRPSVRPTPPSPPSPPGGVEICPGQHAVLNGRVNVAPQVQACIDNTPSGGTLELPPGQYGISTQVLLSKKITLKTKGIAMSDTRVCGLGLPLSPPACATFFALPGCCSYHGMLNVGAGAHGSTINHIMIDGNRGARVNTPQGKECITNKNGRQNANNAIVSAANTTFEYSASINALCASAMEWDADYCNIHDSFFADNGDHYDKMWSDGLTLLSCRHGTVENVVFRDNSDVNLVMGCGTGAAVRNIQIDMTVQQCFAGFMMDNFDNSQCGDYTGMVAQDIRVNCGGLRCDFGANFGPHAWYMSKNIVGGTVEGLAITGAKQGANCGGAGTSAAPLNLRNFSIGDCPSSANFLCGTRPTSKFNVCSDSVVRTSDVPTPTTRCHDKCP